MRVKLRRFLRSAAADLLHHSRAADSWRWFRRRALQRDQVCVLGLHRVLTETERMLSNSLEGMVLTDVTFGSLLEYMQQRFRFVSLDTLLSSEAEDGPKPWCHLTFDDGWKDTYTRAFPRLMSFGIPATVFLATGAIESTRGFWVEQLVKAWRIPATQAYMKSALARLGEANAERLSELEELVQWLKHMSAEKRDALLSQLLPQEGPGDAADPVDRMLTWNEAMEMCRCGIDMCAHTMTHPLLTYENDTTVERELRLSKQMLEMKLGKRVRALAYPNGDWDGRVKLCAEQVGYQCAFTTQPGWFDRRQDLFTIRRILLHEGNVTDRHGRFSPAMLSLTLAGRV